MNQVQEPRPQEANESGKFGKYFEREITVRKTDRSEIPCPPCRLEKLREQSKRH